MTDPQDKEFKTFSLARDEKYILPYIRLAEQYAGHKIGVMLTPWSPPAFMKTNNDRNHGGKLLPEYADAWANYICRYIREYENRGITVEFLTVQNEPHATQTWDSCRYTHEEEREFLEKHCRKPDWKKSKSICGTTTKSVCSNVQALALPQAPMQ